MQTKPHEMLRVSLGIRHHLARLLSLAHEITLVSLNAKVSSAQLGSAGSVFTVMTQEIQSIAQTLRTTVDDVRALTHDWTRLAADHTQLSHQLSVLNQAKTSIPAIVTAIQQTEFHLDQKAKQMPRLTGKLTAIVDDMERSLRVVNYVTVGIMIESERVQDSQQTFDHLAREMQNAAERIREIANYSVKQMNELEGTV